jgi:DNA-binding transcriptional ArsR family regulator
MLRILARKEVHISGLARELNISVPVVSKHVKVLENAGLVERRSFGRTHVLKARIENLYGAMQILSESYTLELKKGASILDVLKQIPGVDVGRVGDREYITSIDGEEGYYIYEVDGEFPNVPINEYELKEDVEIGVKKLLPVDKKRINVRLYQKT